MEDEGPRGEVCGHPSLEDADPQQRDSMGQRQHELMLAYEILCISANCCTNQRKRIEKTGMPDALALLNVGDVHHLKCLAWVVYDGVLLVDPWPKLSGDHPWCTVLAGLQQHIYRGHKDVAHCPPQTLSSWDHQEWVEALRHVGSLSSMQSRWRLASQSQRRSQSGPHHCSQMLAQDRHLHAMYPHMPSRCPHGVTLLPCATARCYCGTAASHNFCTTPKVASAVNVPAHTQSSCSGKGMAQASLDQDKAQEDDFQTQHTPVCHMMWREDDGHRSSAEVRLQHSVGSLGQWTGYQLDIGEEEDMLETVNPTWRATHWLQLVVQGISDDEVPWYDLITSLMVGTKGVALSLAKHLLTIWRWSMRVQGWDVAHPPQQSLTLESS